MIHVQRVIGVSERRACKVIGQPRSTQRSNPRKPDRDRALVEAMTKLRDEEPRYGYRRIWAGLRRSGWRVNVKRVHRLWRQEGFQVHTRQRKRRRLGSSDNSCTRQKAERKNHIWSYDFIMDQTEDGRRLKMLPVVDEYSREAHAILVERSITAADVIDLLEYLFSVHGEPEFIRSDNGPEFIANAVKEWLAASGVKTLYIEPGSPWQNAYSESFNSRFADELLDREIFTTLVETKVLVEQHRVGYNHERPHSSLDYLTPAEFAASLDPVGMASVASAPDSATAFDHSTGEWQEINNSFIPALS